MARYSLDERGVAQAQRFIDARQYVRESVRRSAQPGRHELPQLDAKRG